MSKILITEDDPFVASLYQNKFRSEGFEVSVALDGNAAMKQLAMNPPDVVLLDLMLPEVNGVEVLKFIRSKDSLRSLPVLVLSSSVAGDVIKAAQTAGANRFLSKATCTPRKVVDEVRSVLAAAHTPRPDGDDSDEGLRMELQSRVPPLVAGLRPLQKDLVESDPASRTSALLALRRATRTLSSHAALAGFASLAQMAGSLEVLLNEMSASPKKVTPSTLRTVGQAVDFIPALLEQDRSHDASEPSPLILVLDDEVISRQAVCNALERANLRALAIEDPMLALKVMEQNCFDLIFLDVDMPRMSGLDVCQKLRGSSMNAATPIVFVTALSDFDTRARSESIGGTDFIAKPIVLIELAVKAVLHLLSGRLGRNAQTLVGR